MSNWVIECENNGKSQNHIMGDDGKDHCGSFGPDSLLKQGQSRAHCSGL